MATSAGAVAVALLGGAGVAEAATYTFNKTAAGSYAWNLNGNWAATPAGFPQLAGDIVNLNNNITGDVAVTLGPSPLTIGVLNLGDSSNIFTIQNGSLTFNNNGAGALIAVTNSPVGSATGNVLNASQFLAENLTITQTAPSATGFTPGLTLQGTIESSATIGTQTLTISGLGIDGYTGTPRGNIAIEAAITDGSTGGAVGLTQMLGNQTYFGGTTWLTGANTYSGGTKVLTGQLQARQTSGTPFGVGDITIQQGRLQITPTGSGLDVSLTGVTVANAQFKYGHGGGRLVLAEGTQNSLTFTVGNTLAASNTVLSRVGRGTLMIEPTAIANLGVSTGERFIVNGGVATFGPGMITPTVVATASTASTVGDFLTYDNTDGLKSASGLYTARNLTNQTTGANEITNVTTAAASFNTGTTLAFRTSVSTVINSNQTLTVGDGTNPAGVILNGGVMSGGNTSSTLAFGNSEAVVYLGATAQLTTRITAANGFTKFGPNQLTLSSAANSIAGGIFVNQGQLTALVPGALGGGSSITLMPQTTLDLVPAGNQGATFQHNIILNGGRTVLASNNTIDEPSILTPGNSLVTAAIFTGIISDGTQVINATPPAIGFRTGWARLQGENTYSGRTRLGANGTVVVVEHSSALGVGDNTSATGTSIYVSGSIGLRAGVNVANEFLFLTNSVGASASVASLHAFDNIAGDINGPHSVDWGGTIDLQASDTTNRGTLGADAGVTLRITRATDGLADINSGFSKTGAGTVEILGSNIIGGSGTEGIAVTEVRAGTLLLSNGTTGSAIGSSGVDVKSTGTLGGNGQMNGGIVVRSGGTLAPGGLASGSRIGTFTLTGTATNNQTSLGVASPGHVTLATGAKLAMDLGTTQSDKLNLTRTASVAGTATIADDILYSVPVAFAPSENTIFDLVIATTINYQSLPIGDIAVDTDGLDDLMESLGYTTRVIGANVVDAFEYKYSIVGDGVGGSFDSIRLEVGAVPEPSSLGLLAIGGLGLLARRRRRA